jgi:sulfur relay (sulfurtransferase) DsrF/TusC family protein
MVDAGYPNRFGYLASDKGTMFLIGEGVLLLVVNKKHLTIFTQVFTMLLSELSEYGR